ncbi:hypothetical protein J31TS4_09990 [Paenibacillus sp. J31TS4]|uniref:hypothetical protein n=1 Tax=Paenibacillus sp. J31TS4 TaxID=2807195 RepID=UPI001B18EC20|nr:hypothetical protein [Paenibacillus sp. J31TS4]GIP37719.1 hypothetical protein J31TS4_09990 [Paenibacillus sp. J31TS4]
MLALPPGIVRSGNLCGYPETDEDAIVLPEGAGPHDLLFELLTDGQATAGQTFLEAAVQYKDERGNRCRLTQEIPLAFTDDELEDIPVDEAVVERVKRLGQRPERAEPLRVHADRPLRLANPAEMSELERKYRVEG